MESWVDSHSIILRCLPRIYLPVFLKLFNQEDTPTTPYKINSSISLHRSFKVLSKILEEKEITASKDKKKQILLNLEQIESQLMQQITTINKGKQACFAILCFVNLMEYLLSYSIGDTDQAINYFQRWETNVSRFEATQIIDLQHIFGYFGDVNMLKNRAHCKKVQLLAVIEKYKTLPNYFREGKNRQLAFLKKNLLNNMNFQEFQLPYAHVLQKTKIEYVYKLKILISLSYPQHAYQFIIGQTYTVSIDSLKSYDFKYLITKKFENVRFVKNEKLYQKKKIWREINNKMILGDQIDKEIRNKMSNFKDESVYLADPQQVLEELMKIDILWFGQDCYEFQELQKRFIIQKFSQFEEFISKFKNIKRKMLIISFGKFYESFRNKIEEFLYTFKDKVRIFLYIPTCHPSVFHSSLLSLQIFENFTRILERIDQIYKRRIHHFSIVGCDSSQKSSVEQRINIYWMLFAPQNHEEAFKNFQYFVEKCPLLRKYKFSQGKILAEIREKQVKNEDYRYLFEKIYKEDSFFYRLVNIGLNGLKNPKHSGYFRYIVNALYRAIHNSRTILKNNQTVFRYSYFNEDELSQLKQGQILQNQAFMSSSLKEKVANKYGDLKITIQISQASSLSEEGGFVKIENDFKCEEEYLFNLLNYFEVLKIDPHKKQLHLRHINLDAYNSHVQNLNIAIAKEYHSSLFNQKALYTTQINIFFGKGLNNDAYKWCLQYLASNKKNYQYFQQFFAVEPKISIEPLPEELVQDLKRMGNPQSILYGSMIETAYNCRISVLYSLACIFASKGMQQAQKALYILQLQIQSAIRCLHSSKFSALQRSYIFLQPEICSIMSLYNREESLKMIKICEIAAASNRFLTKEQKFNVQKEKARILHFNYAFKEADALNKKLLQDPIYQQDHYKLHFLHLNTGDTLQMLGEYAQALEHFLKSEQELKKMMKPAYFKFIKIYYKYAQVKYKLGQYQQALSQIREAIKIISKIQSHQQYRFFILQAKIEIKLKQYDEALLHFKQARQCKDITEQFIGEINLYEGILWFEKGQIKKGLTLLLESEKTLKVPFIFNEAFEYIALSYYELGNDLQAYKYIKKLLECIKINYEHYLYRKKKKQKKCMMETRLCQINYKKVIQILTMTKGKQYIPIQIRVNEGRIREMQERNSQAIVYYKQLLEEQKLQKHGQQQKTTLLLQQIDQAQQNLADFSFC